MGALAAPTPTLILGRYALYGEIASGGMATVHFGRLLGPVGFARTVAIKRLHPNYAKDPEFASMFLDEARLAARIRHPNVVPTIDVVATQGELFLVMDYVQGESLARLIRAVRKQGKFIPPGLAVPIMASVLHGLHAAHEAKNERGEPLGIVHRDVSPHNVLVGVDGAPRVLDFGVAKAAGRIQTTREGQLKGKMAYMSPEQIASNADRLTDVYASSVVLWELLTTRRLFDGENGARVMHKVLHDRVEPPSRLAPGIPEELDDIVLRGLARDPSQRFPTAREMARALEKCVAFTPASEIGDWVEEIAGARLATRANQIELIESSSFDLPVPASSTEAGVSPPVEATPLPAPTVEAPAAVDVASHPKASPPPPWAPVVPPVTDSSDALPTQLSSGSTSVPRALPSTSRTGRVAIVLVVAAMSVLILAAAALEYRPRTSDATAPPAAPSAAPPGGAQAAIPTPTPSSSSSTPASSLSVVSASAPAASASTTPRVAHPRAAPPPNCNPPFLVDANGYKRYKRECL